MHVDAEGALATADAIGAGRRAAVRRRPDRDQGQPAGRRHAAHLLRRPVRRLRRAVRRRASCGRLREAGFVIVGKTALPEYGILPSTESRRNGPTRNPWDLSRTPGGSSGGAAAAVAAGMVPLAHGNDGGGSIRIPAACCGLVGLKPARGRISLAPALGDSFLVTDGVLTRTTAESAQLLDLLAGPELGDATWAPPPSEPYADAVAREPGRLRIGFTLATPLTRRGRPDRRARGPRRGRAAAGARPRGRGAGRRAVADPRRVRAVLGRLRTGRRLDDRVRRDARRPRARAPRTWSS